MGRPRSERWRWLPPYTYPDRGRIVYKRGKMKPVKLCTEAEATYDLVIKRLADHLGSQPDDSTLRWLCEEYQQSPQFLRLSASTRRAYKVHHKTIANFAGKNGVLMGDAGFADITTGLLQKYLDKRAEQDAPISGNREVKGYLSAVYAWAAARDMLPRGMVNPCHAVVRNPETARTRYVEDWELDFAIERATLAYLKIYLPLAYLLAGRVTEVLKLQRGALTDEGVRVERLKGSKTNIVRWRPDGAKPSDYSWLEDVVNQALALPGKIKSLYLLHDQHGQPISYTALRNAWDDLMARCAKDAEAQGLAWSPFTRHDLKRKGISDHKSGTIGGHRTQQMRDRYRVREDIEEPVG